MVDKFYMLLMKENGKSKRSDFEISFDLYIHAYNGQLVRFGTYCLNAWIQRGGGGQVVWTPPVKSKKI